MLYKNTITEKMYEIAKVINTNFPEFYLAGGTALSLQLGHRKSIDLDYFINKNFDTQGLLNKIEDVFYADKDDAKVKIVVTYEEANTLWLTIGEVKVSFIKRKSEMLEPFIREEVFQMASVKDILIMKLGAICNRSEYKDYYDIVTISKVLDCRDWVNMWDEINKNSDPSSFIISLAYFDHVEYLELELEGEDIVPRKEIDDALRNIVKEINSYLNLGV